MKKGKGKEEGRKKGEGKRKEGRGKRRGEERNQDLAKTYLVESYPVVYLICFSHH